MKKGLLLYSFLLFLSPIYAQRNWGNHNSGYRNETSFTIGNSLNITSPSGEPFLLLINGVQQNQYPQARIGIDNIPYANAEIKILFTDNATYPLCKRIQLAGYMDNEPLVTTLKVVRQRNGMPRLVFVQASAIEQGYCNTQTGYTAHFNGTGCGNPTVTITNQPMDNARFAAAISTIKASSWDDTRLSTAKTIAASNYFTTAQVIEICKLFTWDDAKLSFAQFAYNRTTDPNNYFNVTTVFTWDDSRQKLNNMISSYRQ
ncbi:MAG: DUF4476 domain-containing protein [Chitinophagia bacterium]|nr:DUF4476 domain-containing protein [Chitinophagia bacterium]